MMNVVNTNSKAFKQTVEGHIRYQATKRYGGINHVLKDIDRMKGKDYSLSHTAYRYAEMGQFLWANEDIAKIMMKWGYTKKQVSELYERGDLLHTYSKIVASVLVDIYRNNRSKRK